MDLWSVLLGGECELRLSAAAAATMLHAAAASCSNQRHPSQGRAPCLQLPEEGTEELEKTFRPITRIHPARRGQRTTDKLGWLWARWRAVGPMAGRGSDGRGPYVVQAALCSVHLAGFYLLYQQPRFLQARRDALPRPWPPPARLIISGSKQAAIEQPAASTAERTGQALCLKPPRGGALTKAASGQAYC
eukprot:SM000404S15667  [mRNA]  locus=s404:46607:47471:+ [translate_table: standard]